MTDSPRRLHSELEDTGSDQRYAELIEQSREARRQGDHWAAQQFATAAHKSAVEERTRLKRLEQAQRALASANRQLQTAWDKDRDCQTIDELRAQHPEFKRVINVWEEAQERVRSLTKQAADDSGKTQLPRSPWT